MKQEMYDVLLKNNIRPMFTNLKINYDIPEDGLVGAEIGVMKGYNSFCILNNLPIKKLYLIDPYRRYEGIDVNYHPANHFPIFKELILDKFTNVKFIKEMSHDAITYVPDELDFVYIDGNHNYEYVMSDILNYFPKVKKGGYLGGHDYDPPRNKNNVMSAVNEFVGRKKLKLHHRKFKDSWKGGDGITDWWVRK